MLQSFPHSPEEVSAEQSVKPEVQVMKFLSTVQKLVSVLTATHALVAGVALEKLPDSYLA